MDLFGAGDSPVINGICTPGLLRDAPHDPCAFYPGSALALVLYNAIFASWAYRSIAALGYIRLEDAGDAAAGYRKALPGLVSCLRAFGTAVEFLLVVDLVLLILAGVSLGVWAGPLFIWTFSLLFTLALNRYVFDLEVTKTGTFSWMTAGFWFTLLVVESVAFSGWMSNALSNAVSAIDPFDEYMFANWMLRYILILLLVVTAFFIHPFTRSGPTTRGDVESATPAPARPAAIAGETGSVFAAAAEKLKKLLPFLWPRDNFGLQLLVLLSFASLFTGRIVVVLVPIQYKNIINGLTRGEFPLASIFLFVLFRFLQSGMLSNLQSFLWLPIGQYTTRTLSVRMFTHMHSLSLNWHVSRKTGEVLRILDRGTSSIVSLLQMLVFTLSPVIIDITVAVIYFTSQFDVYFGVIVIVTMASYIFATILITEWRTAFRREMIELDNRTSQIGVDSLLNFETVKYYGAEQFEIQRYDKAIADYNRADFKSNASLQLLNVMQNVIISLGLLAGSILCAYRVVHGDLSIGDFALFYTYIVQLYGPLNWFGTMYRVLQQNAIGTYYVSVMETHWWSRSRLTLADSLRVDMEKMLKLFDEEVDVCDKPTAKPLVVTGGRVDFNNVHFSYGENHPALQGLSFSIPAGKTVALVGESGGGKSTTLKLLFRFYDVNSGSITIDGQDLRDVTQVSLRQAIGVVPQDPVLFNNTVMYNIRYARPDATDEEVFAAARAAQIHDRVMSFPKGYDTVVGERGLRVSGGERQRLAIARTILKAPSILLLDEATSALDSASEGLIQTAFAELSRNRTTMVIAHRLSTIASADKIACISDGRVAEMGTHEELLALGGIYHDLWQKQQRNSDGAAAASSSPPGSPAEVAKGKGKHAHH
ncbi:ATP-binding cassette-type vacuolar membrane transporter Hmt1 [Blastocladiella emersonii ATCC 22665]|nr:ATP-binding cassette-type vacuolar membrane transporter Hmt1 [Blastocladiella emersonii ATCC 22665]